MNTVRMLQGIGIALLAALILSPPAAAQDDVEADTIWVEGNNKIVIMSDDGSRIIVRGADGEDGLSYFFNKDGERSFFNNPRTFRGNWAFPNTLRFHGDLLDDDDEDNGVVVLSDYLANLDDVWVDHFGDELRANILGSSKERSELMKMEMESQRLARRARRAEDGERAELEQELETLLRDIFDRKQALREERIERLREEMNKALDSHNERGQNREEIIDRRFRQLLGRTDKYDW